MDEIRASVYLLEDLVTSVHLCALTEWGRATIIEHHGAARTRVT